MAQSSEQHTPPISATAVGQRQHRRDSALADRRRDGDGHVATGLKARPRPESAPVGTTIATHIADQPRPAGKRSRDPAPERGERKRMRASRRALANAPVLAGVFAMALYFVWVCMQMAPRTHGGDVLLVVIFGAAIAGAIAGVAGLWRSGR